MLPVTHILCIYTIHIADQISGGETFKCLYSRESCSHYEQFNLMNDNEARNSIFSIFLETVQLI